jgi:hypothetical protein
MIVAREPFLRKLSGQTRVVVTFGDQDHTP